MKRCRCANTQPTFPSIFCNLVLTIFGSGTALSNCHVMCFDSFSLGIVMHFIYAECHLTSYWVAIDHTHILIRLNYAQSTYANFFLKSTFKGVFLGYRWLIEFPVGNDVSTGKLVARTTRKKRCCRLPLSSLIIDALVFIELHFIFFLVSLFFFFSGSSCPPTQSSSRSN